MDQYTLLCKHPSLHDVHAEWQTKCVEKCGHIAEWVWSSKYVNLSRIMFSCFFAKPRNQIPCTVYVKYATIIDLQFH